MLHLFFNQKRQVGSLFVTGLLCIGALSTRSQTTQRNGLGEEFSASTCHPCKDFNEEYHPATVSIGVNDTANHVNSISYQMLYPGSGDLSYNQHVEQRSAFYSIFGIPHLKVNGKGIATNLLQPALYTALDTSRNAPAKFRINGSYEIDPQNSLLKITVNVIPLVSATGKYRVHIAAVERHYTNLADIADVNMPDYYHVMRRMFPDGKGKAEYSWTANTQKTYTYTAPYLVNNPPAQGSFDFWGNPYLSDLVAFVQDSTSKRIMQSQVIKPSLTPVSLKEEGKEAGHMLCYPNPANNYLHVGFTLAQQQEVQVRVTDLSGRSLYANTWLFYPGAHQFNVPVQELSPGLYHVELISGGNKTVKPVAISR